MSLRGAEPDFVIIYGKLNLMSSPYLLLCDLRFI